MSKKNIIIIYLNDNGIFHINFFNAFILFKKKDLITKRIKSKFNSRISIINN
jgi:hypothetical protein